MNKRTEAVKKVKEGTKVKNCSRCMAGDHPSHKHNNLGYKPVKGKDF